MENKIVNLNTKLYENESGNFYGISLGINIYDKKAFEFFLDEIIEKFINHRMTSPPETANMTITLCGLINSKKFKQAFLKRQKKNEVLNAFMSLMVMADILHIEGNKLLDRDSLLN